MSSKNVYKFGSQIGLCARLRFISAPSSFISSNFCTFSDDSRSTDYKMSAWQIHSYGGLEELRISNSTRIPKISRPDDVLVEVYASSVNPIDVKMMGGYGSSLLNTLRRMENCDLSHLEFPMSLGRDFSGRIVRKGNKVFNFKIGDEVWGVVPPHSQGSHAENVLINKCMINHKPKNLTHNEAGSLLYTAVTAWSSLKITGDLYLTSAAGKKVLILGGSGGVGTMAIQLLKAWGAQVVATCNTDALPLVESLGADAVIDYSLPDNQSRIEEFGKFDIILDAAGLGAEKGLEYAKYLKDLRFSKYITLQSPLLHNVDQYGMIGGALKNIVDLAVPNIRSNIVSASSTIRWGFFIPIPEALREISCFATTSQIKPCVEKVYTFQDLPLAYERISQGHLRGKIVIQVKNTLEEPKIRENEKLV